MKSACCLITLCLVLLLIIGTFKNNTRRTKWLFFVHGTNARVCTNMCKIPLKTLALTSFTDRPQHMVVREDPAKIYELQKLWANGAEPNCSVTLIAKGKSINKVAVLRTVRVIGSHAHLTFDTPLSNSHLAVDFVSITIDDFLNTLGKIGETTLAAAAWALCETTDPACMAAAPGMVDNTAKGSVRDIWNGTTPTQKLQQRESRYIDDYEPEDDSEYIDPPQGWDGTPLRASP